MKSNDQNRLDVIIKGLEKGWGVKGSCDKAGIHFSTFYDWTDPDSPRFNSDFSERVKKATQLGDVAVEELCVNVVLRAAVPEKDEQGNPKTRPIWQAAAWMLERRFREKYGIRQTLDHNFMEGKRMYIDDLFPPEDELKEAEQSITDSRNNGKKI